MARSAAGSAHSGRASGKGATATDRPAPGSCCPISSVMKGMNGWRSRTIRPRVSARTASVVRLPSRRPTLANSMYQSQNSCQTK